MRKPVVIALVSALVLSLAAAVFLFVKFRQTDADLTKARTGETAAQGRYTDAINAISEIQDSLSTLPVGGPEGQVSSSLATEQKLSGPGSQQAIERIHAIGATLERQKQRISQLEQRLKKSGVKVKSLEHLIEHLKASVAEKEAIITTLNARVDSLRTEVAGLHGAVDEAHQTIATQTQQIEDKRHELATVYYIIGDKKTLTSLGVIEARGGVLGLGKTLQSTGRFDSSHFTALDTDQQTSITIPAARVEVVSNQPTSSYRLESANGKVTLRITDVNQFRKFKQVVILTR